MWWCSFYDPIINIYCLINQTDWKAVDKFIEVDRDVKEVDWAQPGTKAGLEMLESFCNERLKYFADDRNNPTKKALSDLSPWFHAGIAIYCFIVVLEDLSCKSS